MNVEGREERSGSIRDRLWPDDFGERLERLMEMTDLSRQDMAKLFGVTERTVQRWLDGGMPTGPNFWGIVELSRQVPGGFELIIFGNNDPEGESGE